MIYSFHSESIKHILTPTLSAFGSYCLFDELMGYIALNQVSFHSVLMPYTVSKTSC